MNILDIDPRNDNRWDELVKSCSNSSIYHSRSWLNVIVNSYGYQPFFLVLEDSNKELIAGFPAVRVSSRLTGKRVVGISFSDYADIITRNGNLIKEFSLMVIQYLEKTKSLPLEISCHDNCKLVSQFQTTRQTWNHSIQIKDSMDTMKQLFSSKARQNINIARKKGLLVEYSNTLSDMNEFYSLYVTMRKRKGLLPQPFNFFKSIHKIYQSKDMLDLIFIINNGKRVAGILIIAEPEFATTYALYSGSLTEAKFFRANDILYYHCIKRSIERGMKTLDLGRTSIDNLGLRRFKLKWGAKESVISTYQYPFKGEKQLLLFNRHSHKKIIHYFLSKMPSSVLKTVGGIVYPHLG